MAETSQGDESKSGGASDREAASAQYAFSGIADILERVTDAIVSLDLDWRYTYVNRKAAEAFGRTPENLIGRHIWTEFPEGVGEKFYEAYYRAAATQLPIQIEEYYPPYDRWFENRIYPSPNGLSIFFQDITERKNAEAALRRSEERYRSLVDATSQIVWTNTPEGEMHGVNPDWGAFTGQTEEEYQGYGWAKAVHPEDAQATVDAWRNSVARKIPFVFEHRLRRHDGVYRTFALRAVAVRNADGEIREWVGIHTDITERREMEAAQTAMARQQRQFLRDILSSVTDGRLVLCDTTEDLPPHLPLWKKSAPLLSGGAGLRELRGHARDAAISLCFSEERWQDLITAASETAMNAIVHAGGGQACVHRSDAVVQIWIVDQGQGIDVAALPRAALEKGYTTAGTLGHGMKMVLQTTDRLWLLTGETGTTVVLEMERRRPEPEWMRVDASERT